MRENKLDIKVGTSGYDYSDWVGILYPQIIPKREYLETYSQTFNTLELNFSYYKMPSRAQTQKMVERANPSLDFSIKAHQSLTHIIDPTNYYESTRNYRQGIEPFLDNNRLAAILFEFPYSFHYQPDQRRYLGQLLDEFKDIPSVVEFRNTEWFNEKVFTELSNRSIGLCIMDMPTTAMTTDRNTAITSDIVYIRMHGKNEENWWAGTNISRYDYHYSTEELKDWAIRIGEYTKTGKKVRVYFNNHAKGNAVKNALEMENLISASI